MKNFKRILLVFTMLFTVVLTTACIKTESISTKTFLLDNGIIKKTIIYTYKVKEDKILKQVTKTEGNFSTYKPESTKEEIIDMFEKALVKYKGIEGLKADITCEGDTFVENVEIDYESIDYKKAQTVFGPSFKSPKEVKYTMKGIEKQLLDEGYVEQK